MNSANTDPMGRMAEMSNGRLGAGSVCGAKSCCFVAAGGVRVDASAARAGGTLFSVGRSAGVFAAVMRAAA